MPVLLQVVFETLRNNQEFCKAISEMHVRGAGCIGVTAAYGMYCGAVRAQELVNNSGGKRSGLMCSQ